MCHKYRYEQSYRFLQERVPVAKTVLDVGASSDFTEMLNTLYPNAVDSTGARELRVPLDINKRYDLIVMTEVIEHLHDLFTCDVEDRAVWTGSGQREALKNIAALMRKDSLLFLTTPNAASYKLIDRCIKGEPPRAYLPHVRELTKSELQELLLRSGLYCIELGEWTVWDHHGLSQEQIQRYTALCNNEQRGDLLYCLARKAHVAP